MFRSAADCVKLAEWCREQQKILVLVDDGIRLDYFHPEDAQDAFSSALSKVFLILASTFAEIEGQRFVQRARDRVVTYRNQPRWAYGIPPFGFRIVDHPSGKGKALAHDAEAQAVLHDIASKFLAGGSLTGLAASLNDAGVLSPQDWNRARSGKPTTGTRWTVDKLKAMLRNPATQGVKTANGRPVLDPDGEPVTVGPPSFDPATWGRLQAELAQRSQSPRQRRHSTNPLLGIAKCAVCKHNMRQRSQTTPTGVTHRYYVCGRSPRACPKVSVRADDAEEVVRDSFLFQHADSKATTRVWREGSDHSAELEQTIRTIDSLRDDRAMGLFSNEDDERTFRQQMSALLAKRDELALMPVVKAGWVDVETDQTYGELWPTASAEERRKLLTDARVTLYVGGPNEMHLHVDAD